MSDPSVWVTQDVQDDLVRALLGGGTAEWFGRSGVRVSWALVAIALAPVAKALDAPVVPAALVLIAAPGLLLLALHRWRVRDARRRVRLEWPTETTHHASVTRGVLVLSGPDRSRSVDLHGVTGLAVGESVVVLERGPSPYVLPRALLADDVLAWLTEQVIVRTPSHWR